MHSVLRTIALVPNTFLLASGWRRWLLAFIAGAASVLALPPYGFFPVLLISLPAVIWLLDGTYDLTETRKGPRTRRGFAIGWWFGFGYFLAGLWWIGSAFLVDGPRFAWMLPLVIMAMPAGLALFHGVALALAARYWPERWTRLLLFAALMSLSDWLRGHILTGFPWNIFGYAFTHSLILEQFGSVVGVYGLGLIVLTLFSSPAVLADGNRRQSLAVLLTAGATLACLALGGAARLASAPTETQSDTVVRLVQPSIPQDQKWLPENRQKVFQTYLDLSSRPPSPATANAKQRFVIWPESSVPFLLTREPEALSDIADMLKDNEDLLLGAVRLEQGNGNKNNYYNSVYMVSPEGEILDAYDKVHLVPFGEYLPLSNLLETLGLRSLVDAPGAFSAGFRHVVMHPPHGPSFLPMICYEAIFPGIPRSVNERPKWFLNVTNDAWFGETPGPYQHFQQARFRSIEQGIPLVRVANTGISGVVDGYGHIVASMPLFSKGILDVALPNALPKTIYASFGDRIYFAVVFIFLIFLTFSNNRSSTRDN